MGDPLAGDQFDISQMAEAEVEKLMKQVAWKSIKLQRY